jgi:hypothetical protein
VPGCLDEGKILFVRHLVFIEIERTDECSPCRLVVFQQGGKPLQIVVGKRVRAAAQILSCGNENHFLFAGFTAEDAENTEQRAEGQK